jgi:hypothetical protein
MAKLLHAEQVAPEERDVEAGRPGTEAVVIRPRPVRARRVCSAPRVPASARYVRASCRRLISWCRRCRIRVESLLATMEAFG